VTARGMVSLVKLRLKAAWSSISPLLQVGL
jgi:hypothetical protein